MLIFMPKDRGFGYVCHVVLLCYMSFMKVDVHLFSMLFSQDNLVFLQRWFVKFPQYRNRSLFIAGESYAGTTFFN